MQQGIEKKKDLDMNEKERSIVTMVVATVMIISSLGVLVYQPNKSSTLEDSVYTTPSISIVGPEFTANTSVPYYLNLSFSTSAPSLIINWGDDSTSTFSSISSGTHSFTHQYTIIGSYYVYFKGNFSGTSVDNTNSLVPLTVTSEPTGPNNNQNYTRGYIIPEPKYSSIPIQNTTAAYDVGSSITFAVGTYIPPQNYTYKTVAQYVKLFRNGSLVSNTSIPYYFDRIGDYLPVSSTPNVTFQDLSAGVYSSQLTTVTGSVGFTGSIIPGSTRTTNTFYDFFVSNLSSQLDKIDPGKQFTEIVPPSQTMSFDVGTGYSYVSSNAAVLFNIYQSLVMYQNSSTTQYAPQLASALPTIANGGINNNSATYQEITPSGVPYTVNIAPYTNYTFHIRSSAKFQDGNPVTAWDVLYSIAREFLSINATPGSAGGLLGQYILPGSYYHSNSFYNITNNITVDNTTNNITFHFQKPLQNPDFAYSLFTLYGSITMEASWIEKNGGGLGWSPTGFRSYMGFEYSNNENYFLTHAMADGPYEVKTAENHAYAYLQPNPDFISPGTWFQAPYLSNVTILFIQDTGMQSQLLGSGAADSCIYNNNTTQNSMIANKSAYAHPFNGLTLYDYGFNAKIDTGVLRNIAPGANLPSTFFDSLLVRKAFTYAFNYSRYINDMVNPSSGGYNFGSPIAGVVIPGIQYGENLTQVNQTTGNVPYYDLSVARSYINNFINGNGTSMFSAMGLVRDTNSGNITYNGNPLVIPIFIPYTGSNISYFNSYTFRGAQMWGHALSSIIPGAQFPVLPTDFNHLFNPFQAFGNNSNPMPIAWEGWLADYSYPTDWFYPYGPLNSGGFYSMVDSINPQWFGNASLGNPLAGQPAMIQQVQNFTQFGNYYNNLTNFSAQAQNYSYAANGIIVNESLYLDQFISKVIIIADNRLPGSEFQQYEENALLTSGGGLLLNSIHSLNQTVTFRETGVPFGQKWTVSLSNGQAYSTTQNSMQFYLPSGTYTYTLSSLGNYKVSSNGGGVLSVSSSPIDLTVGFNAQKYKVTFSARGLAPNTPWGIYIVGVYGSPDMVASSNSSFAAYIPNGTFQLTAYAVGGKTNDSFSVSGSSETVYLNFGEFAGIFNLTFLEHDLPASTDWSVTYQGRTSNSTSDAISFSTSNGTYDYQIPNAGNYSLSIPSGTVRISGSNITIPVYFGEMPLIKLKVLPKGAYIAVGTETMLATGTLQNIHVSPGQSSIYVSDSGYKPYYDSFSTTFNNTYSFNISLTAESSFGFLRGLVMPGNATIVASGSPIPVINGSYNASLATGSYYITASFPGYSTFSKEVVVSTDATTWLNITLNKSKSSYTLQGDVTPYNASVTLGGISAIVNATGYYTITMPSGTYLLSVYSPGYFAYSKNLSLSSNMTMNVNLKQQPAPTSSKTLNNTTVLGFNVTVANMAFSDGMVNVSYNASVNGTLTVSLPYTLVENLSVQQLLQSKVYVNNVSYTNFIVTITNTFTVVLTITNLSGDPTLTWVYNPAVNYVPPAHNLITNGGNYLYYYALAGVIALASTLSLALWKGGRRRKS